MHAALLHKITIHPSRYGLGVFAGEKIREGSRIFPIKGRPVRFTDTLRMDHQESYALQVEQDRYLLCGSPFVLINHSCNPNSGIDGGLYFTAIKDIEKEEEITWDYSTSMLERHWTMRCECGEKACRKIIQDFDQLPLSIQTAYLKKGIVMPYIIEFLQQSIAKTA